MNPLSFITRPIKDITQAVVMPFKPSIDRMTARQRVLERIKLTIAGPLALPHLRGSAEGASGVV